MTSIVALFTVVPAICYLLSAIICKRYYILRSPLLQRILNDVAQGIRRNQQEWMK